MFSSIFSYFFPSKVSTPANEPEVEELREDEPPASHSEPLPSHNEPLPSPCEDNVVPPCEDVTINTLLNFPAEESLKIPKFEEPFEEPPKKKLYAYYISYGKSRSARIKNTSTEIMILNYFSEQPVEIEFVTDEPNNGTPNLDDLLSKNLRTLVFDSISRIPSVAMKYIHDSQCMTVCVKENKDMNFE